MIERKIQIKQTTHKTIQKLMLAYNSTLVLHRRSQKSEGYKYLFSVEDCIQHIDQDGNLIREYQLFQGFSAVEMISQKEIAIVNPRCGDIKVINLEKGEQYDIPFKTSNVDLQVHRFPDSELYCIVECNPGGMGSDQDDLVLSYFHVNNIYQVYLEFKLRNKVIQEQNIGNEFMIPRKFVGNSHSLFFYINRQLGTEIKLHDVILEGNWPASRIRSIQLPQSSWNRLSDTLRVWEVRKNVFAIIDQDPYWHHHTDDSYLLFDGATKTFKSLKPPYCYSKEIFIEVFFLKEFILFCEFKEQVPKSQKNQKQTKEYLISIQSNCLEFTNRKVLEKKQRFPEYQADPFDNSALHSLEKNNNQFVFKRMRYFRLKEMYLSMLLEMNEDFDDDLLLDALSVLECIWSHDLYLKLFERFSIESIYIFFKFEIAN